jgi:shikimate dehydrogenase
VLGWPVAHSRSPRMQNAALQAAGLGDWRYQLLPVSPKLFEPTVRALGGAGFRGANVTIPHKESALALADSATQAAREIGAANTLLFAPDAAIEADNTDAPGMIQALALDPAGRTALVLGAGGSARAAVWALLSAGAAEVRVWNRSPERARALSADLGATPVTRAEPADFLVNCTPAGMDHPEAFKQLPLTADEISMFKCVVDFAYARADTPLAGAAKRLGVPLVDGLDLLVAQGALSFGRFTGLPAPVDQMRDAVRLG